ncbi:MAG: insulinase family protein [Marinilabiliaceae bacterium]|nr:insulinase family protein [Marinilabiliaceae bacterium]
MEIFCKTLDNGIRFVHHRVNSLVGHCGLIINAGSRNELPYQHGLAHFTEHLLFKGTKKRKMFHILSRIDDVGGELNAYTTKEETSIYASFLKQDFERAIELLSDITFNSIFPQKEIEKEKEVVIDEINSYKDNPAELILDDFEELLFGDDPMGRNILGTPETIMSFGKKEISDFLSDNYNTDLMVFCTVGNIFFSKAEKLVLKYLGNAQANIRQRESLKIGNYIPKKIDKEMDTFQSHIVLGNIGYDLHNPLRPALLLLNNIMGGPGMNSRLNMALREKNGIAYNVESSYSPYSDTGVFYLYFGTDNENVDKSLEIVLREMKKIKNKKLGKIQLHNAKRQLKGQVTISSENRESLMLSIAKSYLLFNKVDSLEDIYKKIDIITAENLQEIANEIFDENRLSQLIYRQGGK